MLTVITPAISKDLTALDTVKTELGLTGTAEDAFLSSLIRQASAEVASYCGRVLARETVRETFSAPWPQAYRSSRSGCLWLSRWPVAEVISLTDGATALTEGVGYLVDKERGRIERLAGWADVTVEYRAGYELLPELPEDIERACLDLVKRRFFSRSRDPALRSQQVLDLVNKSFTAEGSEPTKHGLPLAVAERLDPYVRFAI